MCLTPLYPTLYSLQGFIAEFLDLLPPLQQHLHLTLVLLAYLARSKITQFIYSQIRLLYICTDPVSDNVFRLLLIYSSGRVAEDVILPVFE